MLSKKIEAISRLRHRRLQGAAKKIPTTEVRRLKGQNFLKMNNNLATKMLLAIKTY